MNSDSPMLLIGIGTAGSNIARGVSRAFGDGLRYVLADTDAVSGQGGGPFSLLGGDRLSGRGAGGDVVAGRLAVEDSVRGLDEHLQGVRLAVIVTALGGGTGGGGTLETVKYLGNHGIPTVVFATPPFWLTIAIIVPNFSSPFRKISLPTTIIAYPQKKIKPRRGFF